MTKTTLLSSLSAFALLAGCSHAPPAAPAAAPVAQCENGPDWTCTGSGACTLPELKGQICAVGSASDIALESLGRQAAATDARRQMAEYMNVQMSGFFRNVQEAAAKAGTGNDAIQRVQSGVQSLMNQTLNGVAVPRTYFNKKEGKYYALAAFDAKLFIDSLKGLKQTAALSEEVRKEIDTRADGVMNEWNKERAVKQ